MNTAAAAHPLTPIKLYRFPLSGNCHRVELFLSIIGLPVELIEVDLLAGAQKKPEFLQLNIFGQVPVIQDGSVTLADSNAILVYLASKYDTGRWLPKDPVQAAEVQRWLTVAAGLVAYGSAAARLVKLFNAPLNLNEAKDRAHRLFAVMEQVLQQSPFLTGAQPTLADIANYSYIAHAAEGDLSLEAYPRIRAWLARIEALPGFVAMAATPLLK